MNAKAVPASRMSMKGNFFIRTSVTEDKTIKVRVRKGKY